MTNKMKLVAFLNLIFIGIGISYSSQSSATTCTPDQSPTSDCTSLVITTGNITINNTVSSSSLATSVTGSMGTLQINSTGASIAGSISATNAVGLVLSSSGAISTLNNLGSISGTGTANDYGIWLSPGVNHVIGNLNNSGSITGSQYAIYNQGVITTLTNTATSGSPTSGIYGANRGDSDIYNGGTIGTLNNAQSNYALVLSGKLPTNYNIIINNASSYGQFAGVSLSGGTNKTTFGIYAGSQITVASYSSVLNGLSSSNLTATTGKYQGMTWTLVPNSTLYDLVFSGTNASVMSSLNQTATALQNVFTLQNSVLVNGFTYDCPVFDKNNICVSVGGRYSTANTDSVNSTGGLLIGAYRLNNQVRMGAYIDQNVSTNSTGIVKVGNASPMVGVFGVWNERLDGTGTEVKVSAGYGQKNTTMNRQVVDGSEAGSGSSTLNTQGVQAIGKYGFAVAEKTIVSPYAGLRYTQNNMGGYTEGSSATVTAPLTYSAVNTNATTLVAGLGANYKVMPDVTLLASAGLENDLNTSNGNYTATGLYGLNSINFNPNPVRTRATGMLGAYYDLAKNQRLGINGIYRQEPYQGVSTTSVMATYTVGL